MELHYLPHEALHGKSIFLKGPEAHHIVRVKRHRPGDVLDFTDGEGGFLKVRLDRCGPEEVHGAIESKQIDPREEAAPWTTLALALLKGDHFELALEKCVELGIHRIVPLMSQRCVVKWKDGASGEKKLARWQRIAESAMKQCGRSWLPHVDAPVSLQELALGDLGQIRWLVADEEERLTHAAGLALPPVSPWLALVGPEGGFSPEEKEWLAGRDATAVSLSPYRLRAETAAVSLVGMLFAGSRNSTRP